MKSAFETIATARHNWQAQTDPAILASHTLLDTAAHNTVRAYLAVLGSIPSWQPAGLPAIDLGAGAGYMTRAFRAAGVDMTAAEHTDEGLALLRRLNPGLPVRQADIAQFHEPGRYGLIVAREIYPVTRVNAFTEQHAMLGRLIDSLASGGVLLLAGSSVHAPHCMHYTGMVRTLARDARVRHISGPLIEALVVKMPWIMCSPAACVAAHALAAPLVAWRRRRGWALIRLIAFVKA